MGESRESVGSCRIYGTVPMSAGQFLRSKYQASYGGGTAIHPIRIQPEALDVDFSSLSNVEPDEDINNPISAIASLGNRQIGLRPRFVTLKQNPLGSVPPGYKLEGETRLAILKPDVWESIFVGEDITYLGGSYTVISKTPENIL